MHTYPVKMTDIADGESRRAQRGKVSRNSSAFSRCAHLTYALGKGDPPAKSVDPPRLFVILVMAMFA